MKRSVFTLLLAVLTVCLLFSACSKDDTAETTQKPVITMSNKTQAPVIATPTVKVTPSPIPTPKVTQVPISADMLGKPNEASVVEVEEKTYEDYESAEGDIQGGGNETYSNGFMCFENMTGGSGYRPAFEDKGYRQIEYSFDVKSIKENEPPWSGLHVGIRSDSLGNTSTSGGQFWVTFKDVSQAYVFPCGADENFGGGAWNTNYVTINIPEATSEAKRITIVDSKSVVCYYMKTSANEDKLFLRVDFFDDKLKLTYNYKDDGTFSTKEFISVVYEEGSIKFWDHYGGGCISNLVIKVLE